MRPDALEQTIRPLAPSPPGRPDPRRTPSRRRARTLALCAGAALLLGSPAAQAAPVAQPVAVVSADRPTQRGEDARFTVDLRNTGDAATEGAHAIRLTSTGTPRPLSAGGDGWSCTPTTEALDCVTATTIPAGGVAAPLAVRRPTTGSSESATVLLDAQLRDGSNRPIGEASRSRTITRFGTGPDLAVLAYDDAAPSRRADALVRVLVSNGGTEPSSGPLTVALSAPTYVGSTVLGASGSGWACDAAATRCTRERPLAAGADAPPILVRTTSRFGRPVHAGVTATVLGTAATDPPGNDSSTGLAPLLPGSDGHLALSVGDAADPATDPRERFVVHARNTGDETVDASVTLDAGDGRAIRASGDGWSCSDGGGSCGHAALTPGERAAPLVATVVVGDDPPARLRLQARSASSTATSERPVRSGRSVSGVAAWVAAPAPTRTGESGGDVVVRVGHRGGPATPGPTVVRLTPTGAGASASGEGWTCTTELRCRHPDAPAPGATLPPISVAVPATDGTQAVVTAAPVVAGVADEARAATAHREDGDREPSLHTVITGARPGRVGTPTRFSIAVHAAGRRALTGPVTARIHAGEAFDLGIPTGAGWTCDRPRSGDATCRRPGPVAAGAVLPLVDAEARPTSSTDGGLALHASASSPDDGVESYGSYRSNTTVRELAIPRAGTTARLASAFTDARPQVGDARASAALVIRNVGAEAAVGSVVARLGSGDRGVDGDGWACDAETCLHPGPVAADGGSLPPLRIEARPRRTGPRNAPTATVTAMVQTPGELGWGDQAYATLPSVPAAHPGRLAVELDPVRAASSEGSFLLQGTIVNTGRTDLAAPTALGFSATGGATIESSSFQRVGYPDDETSCREVVRCDDARDLPARDTRRFTVRGRLAGAAGPAGAVAFTATAGGETGTTVATVVPRAGGADLAVAVDSPTPRPSDAEAVFDVRVRNGGRGPTDGPITVALPAMTEWNAPAIRAAGAGWRCDALAARCVTDAVLPAGATLPLLRVRTPPATDGQFRYLSGSLTAGLSVTVANRSDTNPGNDFGYASGVVLTAAAADPAVRVEAVGEARSGEPAAFRVLVDNDGDRPTVGPLSVDVTPERPNSASAPLLSLAGDGWRCSREDGRCTLVEPLAGGTSAPPIAATTRVTPYGDVSYNHDWPPVGVSAALSGSATRSGTGANDLASHVRPVEAGTADLVLSARPVGLHRRGGARPFEVLVRNAGSGPTTEPVEVEHGSSEPYGPVGSASGDGWVCPDGGTVCRLGRALAAGELSPPLTIDLGSSDDGYGGVRATVSGDPTGRRTNQTVEAAASYPYGDRHTPLGVEIEALTPRTFADPATHDVVVVNHGLLPGPGPVVVRISSYRPASGTGWTCEDDQPRCTHPGPVAPGARLPAIHVEEQSSGIQPGSSTSVSSPSGSSGTIEAAATTGGIGPDVAVDLGPGGTVDPGGTTTITATPRTNGLAVPGPIRLSFAGPDRVLALSAAGRGWTCTAGSCTHPGTAAGSTTLEPVRLTVAAPPTAEARTVPITASVSPDGDGRSDDDTAGTSVGIRRDRSDLIGRIVQDEAPVAGGTATHLIHVRNSGTRPSPGPVTVDLVDGDRWSDDDPRSVTGAGWTCTEQRCVRPGPVAADDVLPTIRVVSEVPSDGEQFTLGAQVSPVARDPAPEYASHEPPRPYVTTGVTADPSGPSPTSDVVRVAPVRSRTAPGDVLPFRLGLQGVSPGAGRTGQVTVALPEGLTLADAPADLPAPVVRGREVTWTVAMPPDGETRSHTFTARVAATQPPGPLVVTSVLRGGAVEREQRDLSQVTVGVRRLDGAAPGIALNGTPFSVTFRGDLLLTSDAYELVSGARTVTGVSPLLVGREPDGIGDRVAVTLPADTPVGTYDAVVRTASGTLRITDAVVVREGPAPEPPPGPEPPPEQNPAPNTGPGTPPGTGAGGGPGTDPNPGAGDGDGGGGGTGAGGVRIPAPALAPDALAALLAGLSGPPPKGAPPTSAPSTTTRRPTIALSGTLRPPRASVLGRSGWLVAVRTSAATAVRADLTADTATARRLGVRPRTVLARVAVGTRRAGVARLRLRVPAALRAKVRRAGRITGTLRVRTASDHGTATASRRVTIRR